MIKSNIVLVNYPLTDGYTLELRQLVDGSFQLLSLSDLREYGVLGMLRYLWRLRGLDVYVPSEDSDSGPVANIMIIIATMIPFACRFQVDKNFGVKKISLFSGVLVGVKVAMASLNCFLALYYTHIDLQRLERVVARRVRLKDTVLVNKVMYLNCNLWFGVKAGGSVGHVAGVVNALSEKNIEVTYYSCTPNTSIRQPVTIRRLRIPDFFGVPWDNNYYNYNSVVSDQLSGDDEKYDVIYQRLSLGNYTGVKESIRKNTPLVIEYNGSEVWVARNWGKSLRNEKLALKAEALCLNAADLVVCISEPLREELVERGVDSDKIIVYPNGVDVSKFNPQRFSSYETAKLRRSLSIPEDAFVFGFIGTFGPWHGAEVLASAFSQLVNKNMELATESKVHLLLIGDGALKQDVSERLNSISSSFYTMTGIVPQESAPSFLSCCDVFCSPHVSNTDGSKFFGSPTKLFEYMAMGKPIIASDLDQVGEIFRDGGSSSNQQNGILVKPGDIEQLCEAMLSALSRSDLESLSNNALALVKNKYTWEKHVEYILGSLSSER